MNRLTGIKNRVCLLAFFLMLFASMQDALATAVAYPDFRTSMLRNTDSQPNEWKMARREGLYDRTSLRYLEIFRTIYEQAALMAEEWSLEEGHRIPRIVHQIWLGSPVPEKFYQWMKSWTQLQGWEYRLWTDENVRQLNLHNQDLYNHAENYGEKTDVLRLEILFRYGGLYVDTDCECLKPEVFDELHKCFDFYIGFEPLEYGVVERFNMFKMCNAVIAAVPEHPLIKDCIINMKANYFAYRPFKGAVERTGPSYLTRIICEYVENEDAHRNIYFPTTFFYPLTQGEVRHLPSECSAGLEFLPETASIHYWSGSWRKKERNACTCPYECEYDTEYSECDY